MTTTTKTKVTKKKPRICRTCKLSCPVTLLSGRPGYLCTILRKQVNPRMHACQLYPEEDQ